MMTNARITECIAYGAFLAPSVQAIGTQATAGAVLDYGRKRVYTLMTGTPGAGGTATLKVQASVDGSTNWTDIPGGATAALAAPGIAQVELQADRVKGLGLGEFVRAVVTVAAATVPTALLVEAGDMRYFPASDFNATGVAPAVLI